MHCPRCGQQQVSDQTKFCSRCGFQLGLVGELLENDGVLPQLAELQKGRRSIFTRKNGVVFSILWLIFWIMVAASLGALGANRVPGAIVAFGFFSFVMLTLASLTLLRRTPRSHELASQPVTPSTLHGSYSVGALPPQTSEPASSYMPPEGAWRVPNTGDLVRPGSVTETTTKLLKKDE